MRTTLNFGAIKDSIYRKVNGELMKEGRNSTLTSFVEAIRNNSIMKKQDLVYKNFEKVKPFETERLAERFIQQNVSIISDVSWPELQNENAKMRQNLLGGPDEWTVFAKKGNEELYENISTLIESSTNKNFNDFEKDAKAYADLVKHLTRKLEDPKSAINEEKERPGVDRLWKFITKNALGYFNERYEALNEGERDLFKILISEKEDKKSGVKNLKDDLSKLIDKKLDEGVNRDDTIILNSFKEKLNKEISEDMYMSDDYIISCFELKEAILKH